MSPPGVHSQPEEGLSFQNPRSVFGFLTELPNKTISYNNADNLTQVLEQSLKHTQEGKYAKQQTHVARFLVPRFFSEVWKKQCPLQSCRR